jgi:hypothetical protein
MAGAPLLDAHRERQRDCNDPASTMHAVRQRHEAPIEVDDLPGDLAAAAIGPRLKCTKCGELGAEVRPCWAQLKASGMAR